MNKKTIRNLLGALLIGMLAACSGGSGDDDGDDSDGDGIANTVDNCVDDSNSLQLDTDADGIGDVCDDLLDSDGDGVADESDNCPVLSNADQIDVDADGTGDACDALVDSDSDNVADAADNCPGIANVDQADLDQDGTGDVCDANNDPVFSLLTGVGGDTLSGVGIQTGNCDVVTPSGASHSPASAIAANPAWVSLPQGGWVSAPDGDTSGEAGTYLYNCYMVLQPGTYTFDGEMAADDGIEYVGISLQEQNLVDYEVLDTVSLFTRTAVASVPFTVAEAGWVALRLRVNNVHGATGLWFDLNFRNADPDDLSNEAVTVYGWTDQESEANYTLDHSYWFNADGSVDVERVATGDYRVTFEGLESGRGTAAVTAYDGANYCTIKSWGAPDWTVNVTCFDSAGNPVDSKFTVDLTAAPASSTDLKQLGPVNRIAYLLADQRASASYTPVAAYSYDSSGGDIQVQRSSTGVYVVTLDDLGSNSDSVWVTAFGDDNKRCNLASWGGTQINVNCFNSSGAAADSQFTLQYLAAALPNGTDTVVDALHYAWADLPASANYEPLGTYSFQFSGNTITLSRAGSGDYSVDMNDTLDGGVVTVTAYGTGNSAHCNVASWSSVGDIAVDCYDPDGTPVDSRYTVRFLSASE